MGKIIDLEGGASMPDSLVEELARAVKACKILIFPTDTVYGMGSTGLVKAASRKIYEIKRRDSMKPLPILVHSVDEAWKWVEPTPAARALAERFWPGPLTLVLKPTKQGRILTTAEYHTLAIRVPAHPVALRLIEASGIPWASTSANLSGSPACVDGPSATALSALVDYVVSAGPAGGRESSVVDASDGPVRVLREAALSRSDIVEAASAR